MKLNTRLSYCTQRNRKKKNVILSLSSLWGTEKESIIYFIKLRLLVNITFFFFLKYRYFYNIFIQDMQFNINEKRKYAKFERRKI